MQIDIITALPGIVEGPLQHSILQRAQAGGYVTLRVFDLRIYTTDKHRQIDDYPYGGGAGMVLKPEPLAACLDDILEEAKNKGREVDEIIFLTPDGELAEQTMINQLSMHGHLILIAGHYKGIDQRIRDIYVTREVSVGDYVLSGGELPALVLVDALVRLVPGVLGDASSALSDSFQDGLLGAPVYTRPAEFRGHKVPEVLLSGDHRAIDAWRDAESIRKTELRRPDLLDESNDSS